MARPRSHRLLLDTNVLLDYLMQRDGHGATARSVMELGLRPDVTLLCAAPSLKDLAYISAMTVRRQFAQVDTELERVTVRTLTEHVPWRCVEQTRQLCEIVAVDATVCGDAVALRARHDDFEDDLVIATARRAQADCVVTSDAELIGHFPEYCMTPAQVVARFADDQN